MRLWHYKLIPHLPRQQLLGQHRECCALRGLGWGKKHSVVNYVFSHSYLLLCIYHSIVIKEMIKRGYKVDRLWLYDIYRGKKIGLCEWKDLPNIDYASDNWDYYWEHNDKYLQECLDNLKDKGIIISV